MERKTNNNNLLTQKYGNCLKGMSRIALIRPDSTFQIGHITELPLESRRVYTVTPRTSFCSLLRALL